MPLLRSRLAAWALVLAGTTALAVGLGAVGLPSSTLFASLVVALAVAVAGLPRGRESLRLPKPVESGGQAVIGVLCGALVQQSTLRALVTDWAPVLGAVLATLAVSLAAGLLLGLRRDVDAATGSFALVAGGAAGLTAISRELGADQRVVAVVQYLRVLVIVLVMPPVAGLLPRGEQSAGVTGGAVSGGAPLWLDLAVTIGCGVVGVALARRLRVPAGSLLGPLTLTAVLTGTGLVGGVEVPAPLLEVAYAVVGIQVGLSFTRSSLVTIRRVLPTALALIVGLTAVTALVGIPIMSLAGASVLDGYLATTPGGLYAVLATAVDTGADTSLILTVQILRLVVMLLVAPVLAVLLTRRRRSAPRP